MPRTVLADVISLMSYGLPPHLHVTATAHSVIVLDTLMDRYFRLGDHDERVIRAMMAPNAGVMNEPVSLRMDGLFVRGGRSVAAPNVPGAISSAIESSPAATMAIRNVSTLLRARWQLRRHGLSSTLAQIAAQRGRRTSIDPTRAAAVARGFERLRTIVPFARMCLPDAFALAAMLDRDRTEGLFVIGVRDAPFAAHAWVQTGTMVLTDPVDVVRELSPILAL